MGGHALLVVPIDVADLAGRLRRFDRDHRCRFRQQPFDTRHHRVAAAEDELGRRQLQPLGFVLQLQLVTARVERDLFVGLGVNDPHDLAVLLDYHLDIGVVRGDDQLAVVGLDAIDGDAAGDQPAQRQRTGPARWPAAP